MKWILVIVAATVLAATLAWRQSRERARHLAPPQQAFPNPLAKEIVGIGVALKWDQESGTPQIADTLPDSPAAEAGLTPGWIIRKIDETVTQGRTLSDCVRLIQGKEGTHVRLELVDLDQNETNMVEIPRQRIQL